MPGVLIRHARFAVAGILAALSASPGLAAPETNPPPEKVRIKDLTHVQGVRENQLLGYGLVVGLQNTGDDLRSRFTVQSVVSMLNRLGVRMELSQVLNNLALRNVAAVVVTAKLPPFARRGARLDVTVASLSSALSLAGGLLLQTPLVGGDGQVYATAQGPLAVGGFSAQGESGSAVYRNHLNTGRVAAGAIVEREVPFEFAGHSAYLLALKRPDFTTASRIARAVNEALGAEIARARARVVVAERTGTVVMGAEVRIATVAVSHGNLNIQISNTWQVSQPQSFSGGRTAVVPHSEVNVKEGRRPLSLVPLGASIGDLVRALNALGATPRDLISILQAIRAAGALPAELEVL